MSDHTPPADAVEAGTSALWGHLGPEAYADRIEETREDAAVVLSAAHAAGTILYPSDLEPTSDLAERLVAAADGWP